jgi:hypothetical protein
MRLWPRRNKPTDVVPSSPRSPEPVEADDTDAALPALRVERAVLALAVTSYQLEQRLGRMEERLEGLDADLCHAATHDDLLDSRLHAAKLAGEIARLNVELRGEIERAFEATRTRAPARSPREQRVHELAETIIDLDDRLYRDQRPTDRNPDVIEFEERQAKSA